MSGGVKTAALSGVKWTSISSLYGVVLQLVQMGILARILSPADFGVIGIALVFITFSLIFLDGGLTSLIIQRDSLSSNQLSTMFWYNIFSGTFFFLLFFSLSDLISQFYEEPKLMGVLRMISISFLIVPFELQSLALLQKRYRFKEIAVREIISKSIGFIVGVLLAYHGYGVYSLVWLHLTTISLSTLLVLIPGLKIFKPRFYFRYVDIKSLVKTGYFIIGDNLLSFFNRMSDNLIIGKIVGVASFGGYNLAKNFTMRPYMILNPILTQVTFPIMANSKNNDELLRKIYLSTINFLCTINFSVYLFIVLNSTEIIQIIFGVKWLGIKNVFEALAMMFMLRSIFNPMGSLFLAKGKPQISFYWNLIMAFLFPLFIFLGSYWEVEGIAFAQMALLFILLIPSWKFLLFPILKFSLGQFLKQIVSPLICGGLTFALSYFAKILYSFSQPFLDFFISGLLFFSLYAILTRILNPAPLRFIFETPRFQSNKYLLILSRMAKLNKES